MIEPKKALVRPRVIAPSGETLLLEDEVLRLAEEGVEGLIFLLGPPGSGKTVALQHLAAILPPDLKVALHDTSDPSPSVLPKSFLIQARRRPRRKRRCQAYRLAPWDRDDLLEYLLAAHRTHCARVLACIQPADFQLLGGLPELWVIVMDRLATDEGLTDVRHALERYLQELLSDTDLVERAWSACLNAELASNKVALQGLRDLARPGFAASLIRLLRHDTVRCLLAAERMVRDLQEGASCDYFAHRWPRALVASAAALAGADPRIRDRLLGLLAGPSWSHAMSTSLLLAIEPAWQPIDVVPRQLAGAYLDGAAWPGIDLTGANLAEASLEAAELRDANLSLASIDRARLRHAHLCGAQLSQSELRDADLEDADLTGVSAQEALFGRSRLRGADFTAASLDRASFVDASLDNVCFVGASMREAMLGGASLEGADFSQADLSGAHLDGLSLQQACWDGACFENACLDACNLEDMCLPAACFAGATLRGALLTSSSMPGASFQGACLVGAGLADIDWEGADLRNADLRQVSFHLGSTRSGLVGSPIACEGSRTGFYTDDYDEQTYRSPEEIRKANLCGADLRGARIEGVDFYLVDLRGACLDPEWLPMLRSCGAIVDQRSC